MRRLHDVLTSLHRYGFDMSKTNTDHLSCLEWGSEESANLQARLAEASDRKIVVSVASYEEQMRGWMALLARKPLPGWSTSR